MVEESRAFKGRLRADNSVSKATTLDLAMVHIQNLEADERKLMEENLALEGQVAAYERLLAGRGARWQKWLEN